MPELTIEEARKIYASSDEMKSLMLTKFSKSELEEHEVTQEEFDKTFLRLLGQCTKTVFLDEAGDESPLPTNRIELRNSDNEWMFDICFTGKNKHFWVSYFRVCTIFANTYSLQDDAIQRLMKNQVNTVFGLDDITSTFGSVGSLLMDLIPIGIEPIFVSIGILIMNAFSIGIIPLF